MTVLWSSSENRGIHFSLLLLTAFSLCLGFKSCKQGIASDEDSIQTKKIPAIGSLETILKESPADLGYVNDSNWFKFPPPAHLDWEFDGVVAGVGVDSEDNVYVTHRGNNTPKLTVWNPDGTFQRIFPGPIPVRPHFVKIDKYDNVWLIDDGGHCIYKMNHDGEVLLTLGEPGVKGFDNYHYNHPTDVDWDKDGNIYVTDGDNSEPESVNRRVLKYDSEGNFIKKWGRIGENAGQFNYPHSIFFDSEETVFVCDRNNWRIQVFDKEGNQEANWIHIGRVYVMVEDENGDYFVSDGMNGRITKFTREGTVIGFFETPESEGGDRYSLRNAHSLAMNSKGDLFTGTYQGWVEKWIAPEKKSFADLGSLLPVPDGTFTMGNPNDDGEYAEFPMHEVTLSEYWIGKYEVTNMEYANILNWAMAKGKISQTSGIITVNGEPLIDMDSEETRISYASGKFYTEVLDGYSMAYHPVQVGWYGGAMYCNWLSERHGLESCYDTETWRADFTKDGFHLPMEAQWERAAGWNAEEGRQIKFANGYDEIKCSNANFQNNKVNCNPLGLSQTPETTPVGFFNGENGTMDSRSPVGCYDMSGNLREWMNDWGRRIYTAEPIENPTGIHGENLDHSGTNAVLRGGGWYRYDGGNRSCDRGYQPPATLKNGFRIVQSIGISSADQLDAEIVSEERRKGSGKESKAGEIVAGNLSIDLGQGVKMTFAEIPAGEFDMGSEHHEEGPVHHVMISKSYFLGQTEVTQEQYRAVMAESPSFFIGDDLPVEMVNWEQAVEFCNKLSDISGHTCRLPTESEWEYAAMAGTMTDFCYGNDLDAGMANFFGKYPAGKGKPGIFRGRTIGVGRFEPNVWKLYDMHGNVWEWCSDWYSGSYKNAARVDPQGPETGNFKLIRGGCWCYSARFARSSSRRRIAPGSILNNVGFRVLVEK